MNKLKLNKQLCFRLYTASRLITQEYEPLFRPMGITYTQYLVLLVLWEEDCQPVNTIGKKLMLGINTTSPLIKRMEALGLVERKDNAEDKRQQLICLTEKGKAFRKEAEAVPDCMLSRLKDYGLSLDEDLLPLVPLLDNIIDRMATKSSKNK
ncbi:MAG: MarR family transcriptional regulator [Bacteroidaceae bacterium]|nr:MarR family transcriptional regulator [Prevotellaceae bacterium]MDY5632373.1 MarR family transcriptional regulator [Bacteroidaceae bacterium]